MSAVEALERIPMSFDDYLALPDEVRAEYVDGVAIVSPPASDEHQAVSGELFVVLRQSLPGLRVLYEVGARTAPGRFRVPDLVARDKQAPISSEAFAESVPVLVVEVLSRSTRDEDLFRKSPEYLQAGIQQYWLVDRAARTLTVLENRGDQWEILMTLDDDRPKGAVEVGEYGTVSLDLVQILDPE